MLFAFKLPLIILSAFNSFFAVGLDGMIEQKTISIANAVISLACGILTSVELLLSLQKKIEIETETYKSYYKLGMDIYRFIEDKTHNKEQLDKFTEDVYNRYQTIVNISIPINIFRLGFKDELCQDADVEQQLIIQAKEINKELDTILEKEIIQNNEIDKIKLWQIEQFNLNQLMIKKFQELDETNVLKHINYLKSVNKIGEC